MPNTDSPNDHILVLGAGELGRAVLDGLAQHENLPLISVLLRPVGEHSESSADDGRADLRAMGFDIVEADIAKSTEDELATIFSRFAQVICCTGFVGGPGTQRKITCAAIRAKVDHYVPWQFGVDYDVVGRGSGQEVFDEQYDVRQMLRAQSRVKWTIISTGMFTSFIFLPAFGLIDLENSTVHALGDWENRLTVTTPEDIGRITAQIAIQWRQYEDRIIYVAGDTFSYAELASTLETELNRPFERVLWTIAKLKEDVSANPDDTMRKYRFAFARKDGVAWPKEHSFNVENNMSVVDVAKWLREHHGPAA